MPIKETQKGGKRKRKPSWLFALLLVMTSLVFPTLPSAANKITGTAVIETDADTYYYVEDPLTVRVLNAPSGKTPWVIWQKFQGPNIGFQDIPNTTQFTYLPKSPGYYLARVGIDGYEGCLYSNNVQVYERKTPTITEQPEDVTSPYKATISLHVSSPDAHTYSWRVSDQPDNTFYLMTKVREHCTVYGQNTDTLSITPQDTWLDGKYIYCVLNAGNSITSDYAKITLKEAGARAYITKQPRDTVLLIGEETTISVEAYNAVRYEWELSHQEDATHQPYDLSYIQERIYFSGYDTDTLTIRTENFWLDDLALCCAIQGSDGKWITSRYVTLTPCYPAKIKEEPSPASTTVGKPFTFSVKADHAHKFFWNVYDPGSTQPYDHADVTPHATVDSWFGNTITLTPRDTWLDGKRIRCSVHGLKGSVSTQDVLMTVTEPKATPTPLPATPTPVPPTPTPTPASPSVGDTLTADSGVYVVTSSGTVGFKSPRKGISALVIPSTITVDGSTYTVTSVEDNACKGNTTLKSVEIGSKVTEIGKNAFYGCTKMTSLTIGSKVTKIGSKAFYKCKKVEKITIPSKVKSIGSKAFYGCSKLKKMTVKTKKLSSSKVGSKAFSSVYSKVKVKVPSGYTAKYKSLFTSKGLSSKATFYE